MPDFVEKRILLVEDEAILAMNEKMQLEKYGYSVRTVTTGEKAVEAVETSSDIDLILMDINLGSGIDGTQAAELILPDHDIPIVFLSSHTEPEVVEKTEKITSYGYVVKNSSPTVLDASIKMAFRLFDSKINERKKEESLRQITESMEEVFWLTDSETGEMLYVSPSYEAVWGRSCESLYDNPNSFIDTAHEDDKSAVSTAFSDYAESERFDLEYRIVRPGGEIRWIRAQCFPVKNDAGAIVRNSGIAIDITERKWAEESIQKRLEELTQPLNDATGIGIEDLFSISELQRLQEQFSQATGVASIITEPDGTPITTPSNFRRLCSGIIRQTAIGCENCLKSDALLGRPNPSGPTVQPCLSGGLWDAGAAITVGGRHIANWLIGQVRDEEQSEEKIQEYAQVIGADENEMVEAFRDVPAMSQKQFRHIADVLFTFTTQLSKIAYQNVQQARFITERKHAEDAVKEQRNFAENLIETAQTIILVLDSDGQIVRFNSYTEELLGYSLDEVKGKNWVETFVQPEDGHTVAAVLRETLSDSQTRGNINSVTRKDGRTFLVEWNNKILTDADGRTTGILATGSDITERRQMENTLHESVARYNDLVSLVPVGIYIVWIRANGTKDFEYVSERWCSIHKICEKDVLANSNTVYDLVHPDDRESFLDLHQEAARERKPFLWEGRFFSGDGTLRWLHIESTPMVFENGDIRWFGVTHDITERKHVDEEMIRHKEYLERILETTSDGFLVVAPDRRITHVNPAYCQMTGYSSAEIVGMVINDFDATEDPDETATRLNRILENGSETFETKHRRKDGSLFDVEVSASRMDWENEVWLVSFCRDITEVKRKEQALSDTNQRLERSEARYRSLFDNSSSVMLVIDPADGQILRANPSAERYYGWDADALTSMHIQEINQDSAANVQDRMVDAHTKQRNVFHFRHRNASGSIREVEVFSSPMKWEGKEVLHSIIHDITDRVDFEQRHFILATASAALQAYSPATVDYTEITETAKRLSGATYAALNLFHPGQKTFTTQSIAGLPEYIQKAEKLLGHPIVGRSWDYDPDKEAALGKNQTTIFPSLGELASQNFSAAIANRIASAFHIGEVVVVQITTTEDTRGDLTLFFSEGSHLQNTDLVETYASMVGITLRRIQTEQANAKLMADKETLLREVHHRIKNNMNTMTSLLALQADTIEDAGAISAIKDAESRLRSMQTLYDQLYASDSHNQMSLIEYVKTLVPQVVDLFPAGKDVAVSVTSNTDACCTMGTKRLSAVGLIVNELVTNTMKYAFPGTEPPMIHVATDCTGEEIMITVEDNGVGIPESFDQEKSPGFGLVMINAMTSQLDGTLKYQSVDTKGSRGTRVVLRFPSEEPG